MVQVNVGAWGIRKKKKRVKKYWDSESYVLNATFFLSFFSESYVLNATFFLSFFSFNVQKNHNICSLMMKLFLAYRF